MYKILIRTLTTFTIIGSLVVSFMCGQAYETFYKSIDWTVEETIEQAIDDRQSDIVPTSDEVTEGNLLDKTLPLELDSVALPVFNDYKPDMLEWVVNCESSGKHEGVWGAKDEYGILQYKIGGWRYLSNKYKFVGEWKNRQDQIDLFLLVSDEDKEIHWSCYRQYLAL